MYMYFYCSSELSSRKGGGVVRFSSSFLYIGSAFIFKNIDVMFWILLHLLDFAIKKVPPPPLDREWTPPPPSAYNTNIHNC